MVVLRATRRNKLLSLAFIQSLQIRKEEKWLKKKRMDKMKKEKALILIFSLTITIYYICGITFKVESTVSTQ